MKNTITFDYIISNPPYEIGNALQRLCLIDFSKRYNDNYQTKFIDDLDYAQHTYDDEKQKEERK